MMRFRNPQTAGIAMYVVNVDHPTNTSTIHLIGGCTIQNENRLATYQSEWSYEMLSLANARDYAQAAGKHSVIVCRACEKNDGFGA
jgi:hypothetical protein